MDLKERLRQLGWTTIPPIRSNNWDTIYQRDVFDSVGNFVGRMSSMGLRKLLDKRGLLSKRGLKDE